MPEISGDLKIGQYVRMVGKDMGTGKIDVVRQEDVLTKRGKIESTVWYGVTWLDTKGQTSGQPVVEFLPASVLVPSARSVPTMTSPEEAEAWLAQQMEPGNWVGKVDDMVASEQEAALALACLDCVTIEGKQVCTRPGFCQSGE